MQLALASPAIAYRPPPPDPEALIAAHSQLVRRIAWHVHARVSSAVEIEDLIQIGMVALVEAARAFEDRGHAFATYASVRVRGAMIDQLRRDARIGRSGMARRREIARARDALEAQLCRRASDPEMAEAMGMPIDAWHAAATEARAAQQESIDDAYSDHDAWFADLSDSADTMIEAAQMRARLAATIADLEPRQALVLQLYFVEEMNLEEIGATINVSAARICQIKRAALTNLRAVLSDE